MSGSRGFTKRSSNNNHAYISPLSIPFGADPSPEFHGCSHSVSDNLDGLIGFTLYSTGRLSSLHASLVYIVSPSSPSVLPFLRSRVEMLSCHWMTLRDGPHFHLGQFIYVV